MPPDTPKATIDRLNNELTGPLTSTTDETVDAESGLVPPAWWDGDEGASRSSMTARAA